MVKLAAPFSRLGRCRALVAGDFMLDRYTLGAARRISPEAPVVVLQVSKEDQRPGGAGNVALNLFSLGAEVTALGRVGGDEAGALLKNELEKECSVVKLFVDPGCSTPIKNRIIADNQQVIRVDYEKSAPLCPNLEEQVILAIPSLVEKVDIVAISDYGKGFLSKRILRSLIDNARERSIPVITDPKGSDFLKYAGSTIIKPNYSEALQAAGLGPEASLEDMAMALHQKVAMDYLVVTRSQAGISIFPKKGDRSDYPVKVREVKDVTGAGDTVLATFVCALANGLEIGEAAQLSNIAAGIAIERTGCARVSLSELAHRLLDVDAGNKVFGAEHLFALQEALKQATCSILVVDTRKVFTLEAHRALQRLSQQEIGELVVYIEDEMPDERLITLLASLQEVDFIIVKGESLAHLIASLKPQQVIYLDKII